MMSQVTEQPGAQLNARDALDLGLADHFVLSERRDELLDALAGADYGSRRVEEVEACVQQVVEAHEERNAAPAARLWPWFDHVQQLVGQDNVIAAVERILADSQDDAWLAANRARLKAGSPTSAHLVWQMLERHRHTSLADVFRDELSLSVRCCRQGDIAEGVRALLIDKDKNPQWRHADVASVPEAEVQELLTSLWSDTAHPLYDL